MLLEKTRVTPKIVAGRVGRIALAWGCLLGAAHGASAATFQDPPVFSSANGQLSLLMVAAEHPQSGLTDVSGRDLSGVKFWTYQVCALPNPAPATGVPSCPAGTGRTDLGGVRLALKQGDTLRIRLVNALPRVDKSQVEHVADYPPLMFNPTNLHTHGLIVDPHNAMDSKTDPYGDYVLLELPPVGIEYTSPVPHGTVINNGNNYVDYLYNIESAHPSGLFWFHPHLHGISLNQVSAGMAGVITVGTPVDYCDDAACISAVQKATVRHLTLKDTQILAGGTLQTQEDPAFCGTPITNPRASPPNGSCAQASAASPPPTPNGTWIHTVSGQVYPSIDIGPSGDVWEVTNASGSRSYALSVGDPTRLTPSPVPLQVLAIDGVTINAKAAATQSEIATLVASTLDVVPCPGASSFASGAPICATTVRMMPSSRVAARVLRPDSGTASLALRLYTALYGTGPLGVAGDQWPAIGLASVTFAPRDAAAPVAVATKNVTATTVAASGQLQAPSAVRLPDTTTLTTATSATAATALATDNALALTTLPPPCPALPSGSRRRIKFAYPTATTFGLGTEVVDANGNVTDSSPVGPFNPSKISVCVPVPSSGQEYEVWELQNYTPEDHNFHIHQTRFFVVSGGVLPGFTIPQLLNGDLVLHDNIPLTRAAAPAGCDGVVGSKLCAPTSTYVVIPFREIGDFVFHCHILEHEDGGMMARIRVQPAI